VIKPTVRTNTTVKAVSKEVALLIFYLIVSWVAWKLPDYPDSQLVLAELKVKIRNFTGKFLCIGVRQMIWFKNNYRIGAGY
ncbi:MAG TPA: hypothetical protein VK888_01335, partial [Anaerolineales bacterium]|nr:hypothetical protein [Anaerolineales bacterium]